jgi:small-conductance mechanosensitive channel
MNHHMVGILAIVTNWQNWTASIIIVAAFVVLALLVKFFLQRIVSFFTRKTKTIFDDLIVKAIVMPVNLFLIFGGLWVAIGRTSELQKYHPIIHQIFASIFIVIGALAITRVFNALLIWYSSEIATKTQSKIDDKLIPLLRRVVIFVIFVMGLLFILQAWNVNISALLAAIGIGGIAVALALQPTLANFLAGTYVMSDAVIRIGDYILLDGGHEGFVESIGWRTTKLRSWQGNAIVIPNSKLADAVTTDFEEPEKSVLFSIDCGVSYQSDLENVEKVTIDVAREVLKRVPEGAKDYEPVVRFKQFSDSNINFSIVLKSNDRAGQFVVKHEFIKALSKRYREENIHMEYPVRKLLIPDVIKTAL